MGAFPKNGLRAWTRLAAGVCEERALASAVAQLETLTVSAEDWDWLNRWCV